MKNLNNIFPIIITSFGFGIIIPTLSDFTRKKYTTLYKSIIVGSIIPLIIYILWIFTILGIFPTTGEYTLSELNAQKNNFDITFMYFLEEITLSKFIFILIIMFSMVSILTSIIGVTLSLNDFLIDGFNLKNITTMVLIIIPATFFSIYYTTCFTSILKFGGILVSLLLGILPITMTWYGRYKLNIKGLFKVPGGKILLIMSYIFFSSIIANEIYLYIF